MNSARMIAALVVPGFCVAMGAQGLACLNELTVQAPSVDGGDDAGGCAHVAPPLPPNVPNDTANDISFVTAIRRVRFKTTATGEPIGLDLDRYCTCQGEAPSCIAPANQDPDLGCDLALGRDNTVPQWIRLFELVLSFDPETDMMSELYSSFAEVGRWSVLIRVSGYNGQADDSNVRVDWLPSSKTMAPPLWDGTDVWPIYVDSLTASMTPLYFDTDAYVTNNQLVFSLPQAAMRMTNGLTILGLQIDNGTVVVPIEKDGTGRFALRNGIFAGRMPVGNLFQMLTDFRDHNGAPFCAAGNPFYLSTRDAFCRIPDIQAGFAQPNKICDAASFGLGFDAEPIADVGAVTSPLMASMYCPPGEDPYTFFQAMGCPQPAAMIDAGNLDAAAADAQK